VALAAFLSLLPVTVEAHARLLASDPAPGVTLTAPPGRVTLYFSEDVSPAGRGISVYGPDGRLVSDGAARAMGPQLSTGVGASGEGTYVVVFTVVSGDTHPSRGRLTFNLGRASPPHAPGLGGADVGLVSPLGLVLQALARWLHLAGYALGFGAGAYALLVLRAGSPRLAAAGVAFLLASEPLSLLAQTASLDPGQTFDPDALAGMLASSFGRVLGLRVGLALLLWATLGALGHAAWLRWGVPVLGVAMALVDSLAAHPIPALPAAAAVLVAVHVGAMGIWIGGLVGLVMAPVAAYRVLAAWSAGLLVVSGAALALLHFGSPAQLLKTAYGVTLLVKLPLVAAALALGWRGRRRWELAVGALVLVAAAVLVSLPPPR
jgi:copper transport protein